MRIAAMGAGAVGRYHGGPLARAGQISSTAQAPRRDRLAGIDRLPCTLVKILESRSP